MSDHTSSVRLRQEALWVFAVGAVTVAVAVTVTVVVVVVVAAAVVAGNSSNLAIANDHQKELV